MRTSRIVVPALLLVAAACTDFGPSTASFDVDDAFMATTAGFSQLTSSFASASDGGAPWSPPARAGGAHARGVGRGVPPMRGRGPALMGGGLAVEFLGIAAVGAALGPAPFSPGRVPETCVFSDEDGRLTCEPRTVRGGLTVERSIAFADADGAVQSAPDSTTDLMNNRVAVYGTLVRPRDTTVVDSWSDRTVTGLAAGSAARTVNGAANGTETSRGTSPRGTYIAARSVADTIVDVRVPVNAGRPPIPVAGRIVRVMQLSLSIDGEEPVTRARREVVTFDGSATATVEITQDGVTKACTMPLPRGRLNCP